MIEIIKLNETGIYPAMAGLSLNRKVEGPLDKHYLSPDIIKVANRICRIGGGENKFLEQVDTFWLVRGSLNWWIEADTYRLTSKQSSSTMNSLSRRHLTQDDFNTSIPENYITYLNVLIDGYNADKNSERLELLKDALPTGYLQTREWKLNYLNIRNIITNREHHRLPSWRHFCKYVKENVDHPEWLER